MKNISRHKLVESRCPQCGNLRKVRSGRELSICEGCRLQGMKGTRSRNWKGGVTKTSGRILIWEPRHPYAVKSGYVLRSHLVIEKELGRYVLPNENVHHINGNKEDDNPRNLSLHTRGRHTAFHNQQLRKSEYMIKCKAQLHELKDGWLGVGMPTAGQQTRGFTLGHKKNDIYVFTICTQCFESRWVNIQNHKRAMTTLCHNCSSLYQLEKINGRCK